METKIDPALQRQLQAAQACEPDRRIHVIVTVVPGSDLDLLAQRGLAIERAFALIPAVSGTLRASDVAQLARLDAVVRLECDSPVHTTG